MRMNVKAITRMQAIIICIVVIIVVAIAGISYYYLSLPAPPKVTPKIGIIYPLTGPMAAFADDVLDGTLMAIEDHGKLLGETPRIVVRDSACDPAKAAAAARELILTERVHVIIGEILTPVMLSVAEVCKEYKTPLLYPSGGYVAGCGKDFPYPGGVIKANPQPYMVYTNIYAWDVGAAVKFLAEKYGFKWYFIASDYEYGRQQVGAVKYWGQKFFGDKFKVVGEAWPAYGETDYSGPIAKAIVARPDVVFVCVPGRFVHFQKQAKAMGLSDIAKIVWAYGERDSAVAAGEAAYGVVAIVMYVIENPYLPQAKTFAKRFYDKYGFWPGWPSVTSYDGTRIFLKGIEQAGSLDGPTIMKAFIKGVRWDDNPTCGAPFYIRPYDLKAVRPYYIAEWTPSTDYPPGDWKFVAKIDASEEYLLPVEYTARYDLYRY
jgi:branched-chain amino acid transport system substrate-binding protein